MKFGYIPAVIVGAWMAWAIICLGTAVAITYVRVHYSHWPPILQIVFCLAVFAMGLLFMAMTLNAAAAVS